MTKMERIARSFDQGPPPEWTPRVGERVASCRGYDGERFVFDVGEVKGQFETGHFSGNTIISYKVEFLDGSWCQTSKNNMRPIVKGKQP